MRTRTLPCALLLALAGAVPGTATACRIPGNPSPILHETLPDLAAGLVAAEVEIVSAPPHWPYTAIEARVVAMIRGDFAGTRLRIAPLVTSSCDGLPSPGQRGIVVGRVLSRTGALLVVDPVRAPSRLERERQRQSAPPPPAAAPR